MYTQQTQLGRQILQGLCFPANIVEISLRKELCMTDHVLAFRRIAYASVL
jgi:hypothetical protein